MIDDIFDRYSLKEFLNWIEDREVDSYLDSKIAVVGDNTVAYTALDVEAVAKDFLEEFKRYEVVRRGFKLYIFDNKKCDEVISWTFDADNEALIQQEANNFCNDLNNGRILFTGHKHKCG